MHKKRADKKGFVWRGLRVSFVLMILVIVLRSLFLFIISGVIVDIMSGLVELFILTTLIMGIIHLKIYKEKRFAITSIVVSGFFILLIIVGIIIVAWINRLLLA
jgi:hypothetical protein